MLLVPEVNDDPEYIIFGLFMPDILHFFRRRSLRDRLRSAIRRPRRCRCSARSFPRKCERRETRRGIEQNVLNQNKYELEEAMRVLAEAVVDNEQARTPIGSLSDWGLLAPEVISDLWVKYAELRAEHDPIVEALTEAEFSWIREALSKKNAHALRYFGASRLSRFLLTSGDQPASSSTGKFSSGDSSPDT